jgi:hypothetical protein
VKWQKRPRRWGGVRLDAVLVESVRVDGKPRQRALGCLGGLRAADLHQPAAAHAFWRRAGFRLKAFKLTKAQHAAAVARLSDMVPMAGI